MTQSQGKAWVGWLAAIVRRIRINRGHWRRTLHHSSQPDTHRELAWAPPSLQCSSTRRARGVGGRDRWGGQRGLPLEAASEQNKGTNHRSLHTRSMADRLDLCLQLSWAKSWHGPASPQHSLHLWQLSQCWERDRHTLKENGASSCPQGFCSSSLGSDLAPDGVVAATEKRENTASRLTPVLAIPSQPQPLSRWQWSTRPEERCDLLPCQIQHSKDTDHLQSVRGSPQTRTSLQDCSR